MREAIQEIRENLRAGSYRNEAAVSQGIVLRMLNELSWPIHDPSVVAPEYGLRGTRVDYALCHPPHRPLILVEVKKVGLDHDAVQQLFGYAVHHGVPMAILSTGQKWHFFLPGERGNYEDRRVLTLDLLARDAGDCETLLNRYLGYQRARNGTAYEAARTDLHAVVKEREILRILPEVLDTLTCNGETLHPQLVADRVENLCGYILPIDTVASHISAWQQALSSTESKEKKLGMYTVNASSQSSPKEKPSAAGLQSSHEVEMWVCSCGASIEASHQNYVKGGWRLPRHVPTCPNCVRKLKAK